MPGAWWGAPPKPLWKADAPQSDPIPIGPPGIPNASPAPEPSFAPPVWSEVDPYDKVTFDAELRRTGNRALALETAKAAHRAQVAKTAIEKKPIIGKNDKLPSGQSPSAAPPLINSPSNISQTRPDAGITSGDVDKNKLATKNRPVFQLPPPSVNEPYDPNDFQQLTGIGKSPELAFETAKELHQLKKEGLGKISVTGKGLTAPNIPKIPPPEPVNGLINPKFGKVVIRWGDTPEDALDRRSEIDAAEIAKFKSFGITKDTIIGWEATYKNDFKRNHNNYMALARYKLMSKILEQWGD